MNVNEESYKYVYEETDLLRDSKSSDPGRGVSHPECLNSVYLCVLIQIVCFLELLPLLNKTNEDGLSVEKE